MTAHKLTITQRKQVIEWLALELRRNPHKAVTHVLTRVSERYHLVLSRQVINYYRRAYAKTITTIQSRYEREATKRRFIRLVCPSDPFPAA